MPEKLLLALPFKKVGLLMLGTAIAGNTWVHKNWFEFVKLGILIAGIVWGVGQTINSQGLAIERQGQEIVNLKAQEIVDQAEHKQFAATLSSINTSQQLIQQRLEHMQEDIDDNEEAVKELDNTSDHLLKRWDR
jgi:flagellar motility protein MotE (MotC chaperone)